MSEFGDLLRLYRNRTRHPQDGRKLTQGQLAELLECATTTVAHWETGRRQIAHRERQLLVSIIHTLHDCQGINTLDEANRLLRAGNYRDLEPEEIKQIDTKWLASSNSAEMSSGSAKMGEFGGLLRLYRNRTRHPQDGRKLTQEQLAELLECATTTVAHWETGRRQIAHNDRQLLVSLIMILYQYRGINSLDEANQLLRAGSYRDLEPEEIERINLDWNALNERRQLNVFLSYGHENKPQVDRLYEVLRRDGTDPWLDQKNLSPGQNWKVEISKAIKRADVILICLSSKTMSSDGYFQEELRLALDEADKRGHDTITVVPLRLENCDIPRSLGNWQCADLFNPYGYEKLLTSLADRANQLDLNLPKLSGEPLHFDNGIGATTEVTVSIDAKLENFTNSEVQKLITSIARVSGLDAENIIITDIKRGSIQLVFEVTGVPESNEATDRLRMEIEKLDGELGFPIIIKEIRQFHGQYLKKKDVTTILCSVADPSDLARLRLIEELREIQEAIERSGFSQYFDIKLILATRVRDLLTNLLRHEPSILHFSGHGDSEGFIFQNKFGKSQIVSSEALANLFCALEKKICCVVVNTCCLHKHLDELAKFVDCVVGMTGPIDDVSALAFSSAFYEALTLGKSVQTAVSLARAELVMEELAGHEHIQICTNKNPEEISFAHMDQRA